MIYNFCSSLLIVASCFFHGLWPTSAPEMKELMVTARQHEITVIPQYFDIPPMPKFTSPVHVTDFAVSRYARSRASMSSSAMATEAYYRIVTPPTATPEAVSLNRHEMQQPRAVGGSRSCIATASKTSADIQSAMTQTPSVVRPLPASLAKKLRQFKPGELKSSIKVQTEASGIAEIRKNVSGEHRDGSMATGGCMGALGAFETLRLYGSFQTAVTDLEPLRLFDVRPALYDLDQFEAKQAGTDHNGDASLGRPVTNIICRLIVSMPERKRRALAYLTISAAIIFVTLAAQYAFGVAKSDLRLRLAEMLEKGRCVGSAQDLATITCLRILDIYKKTVIALLVSSPICTCFPSSHEPSTEEPETGLCAPQHVDTGPLVACAVPKLGTTSLVVSHPTWPREQVARLRLVSVSGPYRADKVDPPPTSKRARAEIDGVDHKDTFAFAFEHEDPWASQVVSTILKIQDSALRSPLSAPCTDKQTGSTTHRDDDEEVQPLQVCRRQECMPIYNVGSEAREEGAMESLDVGTRVANCLALRRFHSDSISSIYEGSNQARCAVFSLAAEVGRTEDLRKYKREIEYIERAARLSSQPTQSQCSSSFTKAYVDDNNSLLQQIARFESQAAGVVGKLRTLYSEYQTQLRESARGIAVPETEKVLELVSLYLEHRNSSAAKQLATIERALETRAAIDQAYLAASQQLFEVILPIIINDYTESCGEYLYSGGPRYEECGERYYAELLTRRISAYRLLDM